MHFVAAFHPSNRSFQNGAARVLVDISTVEYRLFADDAFALDFFDAAIAVGDEPAAPYELHDFVGFIGNPDPVGEHVAVAGGVGLLRDKEGFNVDANTVGE